MKRDGAAMPINYDPDNTPEVTPEMLEEAERMRFQPIHVICDEPGSKVGDLGAVSFIALAGFLPRAGDHITLSDGTVCEVKRTHFRVEPQNDETGRARSIWMMPNVFAVRVGKTDRGKK